MTITIIIPCYNELNTIEKLLRKILSLKNYKLQIIIVDDCSIDGTKLILKKKIFSKSKIIYHKKNKGKGAAINTAKKYVKGDIVIIQDADLEYDPHEFNLLLSPILNGHADVVYGSRFMGGRPHRILFFWHTIGNKFLTFLSNAFTNLNLTDMETCYKMFRREVIQGIELRENRFGFEPEVTAKISKIPGIRIYEVGISYFGRTYAEGKKINWKDGFRAIYCILKYSFTN
jgi:glycosyltransferase involved in cell wall biosynthesis